MSDDNKKISNNTFDYSEVLSQAINQIRHARKSAAKQLNATANSAYWNLGKLLFEKQLDEGYGSGVVKQLSIDLKKEFPDMGLSPRNLWDMKRFYERYHLADQKLRQAVAVLPWGHNLLLINKIQSLETVAYYANETVTNGWSRDILLNAIKMDSYAHAQKQIKSHNFSETLPNIDADYANEVFKDAYNLGFLGITEHVKELQLEKRLVEKNKIFCIGTGQRFFIYRQPIPIGIQQQRILCRYAFLSQRLTVFGSHRIKNREFQGRICGKNESLSFLA